jgi:hypothetical protein
VDRTRGRHPLVVDQWSSGRDPRVCVCVTQPSPLVTHLLFVCAWLLVDQGRPGTCPSGALDVRRTCRGSPPGAALLMWPRERPSQHPLPSPGPLDPYGPTTRSWLACPLPATCGCVGWSRVEPGGAEEGGGGEVALGGPHTRLRGPVLVDNLPPLRCLRLTPPFPLVRTPRGTWSRACARTGPTFP